MPLTQPGAASTTPKRRQRTPAPAVSPTVAKLLAQIHAEAEAQTLAALSAKDGFVVLQPVSADGKRVRYSSFTYGYTVSSSNGAEVAMYRDHINVHNSNSWHPAHWWGSESLVDGQGREWHRSLAKHVMDDFGNLVEVPA